MNQYEIMEVYVHGIMVLIFSDITDSGSSKVKTAELPSSECYVVMQSVVYDKDK